MRDPPRLDAPIDLDGVVDAARREVVDAPHLDLPTRGLLNDTEAPGDRERGDVRVVHLDERRHATRLDLRERLLEDGRIDLDAAIPPAVLLREHAGSKTLRTIQEVARLLDRPPNRMERRTPRYRDVSDEPEAPDEVPSKIAVVPTDDVEVLLDEGRVEAVLAGRLGDPTNVPRHVGVPLR